MVALFWSPTNNTFIIRSGGSILSDQHILSATHCFLLGEKLRTWQSLSSMKIVLGDTDKCDEKTEGIQEFSAAKVYYHYAYDNHAILNDVVIIKLNKKIRFTSKISPIKMADKGMDFDGQFGLASGWGLTNLTAKEEKKRTPEILQSVKDLYIGNSSYCKAEQLKLYPKISKESLQKYPKYSDLFASLLCTYVRDGSLAKLVGQGDSGGPLVVNYTTAGEKGNKTELLLVGVISYMLPITYRHKPHDISNYVDFYQSVAYFRKWIDLAMQ